MTRSLKTAVQLLFDAWVIWQTLKLSLNKEDFLGRQRRSEWESKERNQTQVWRGDLVFWAHLPHHILMVTNRTKRGMFLLQAAKVKQEKKKSYFHQSQLSSPHWRAISMSAQKSGHWWCPHIPADPPGLQHEADATLTSGTCSLPALFLILLSNTNVGQKGDPFPCPVLYTEIPEAEESVGDMSTGICTDFQDHARGKRNPNFWNEVEIQWQEKQREQLLPPEKSCF